MKDLILGILGLLAVLVLIVGGLWLYFAGPCEFYMFAKGADIPGRCLMGGG